MFVQNLSREIILVQIELNEYFLQVVCITYSAYYMLYNYIRQKKFSGVFCARKYFHNKQKANYGIQIFVHCLHFPAIISNYSNYTPSPMRDIFIFNKKIPIESITYIYIYIYIYIYLMHAS